MSTGFIAIAGILGLICITFASPRLMAALIEIDARNTLWKMRHDGHAEPQQIASAAADLDRSLEWIAAGETKADRGYLLIHLPIKSPAILADAEKTTAEAVSLAPAQPLAWARQAWIQARRGDKNAAIHSLRMSFLTGALTPEIMSGRLNLGLQLYDDMDLDTQHLLERQIRLLWIMDSASVISLSKQGHFAPIVRDALNSLNETEMGHYLRNQERNR